MISLNEGIAVDASHSMKNKKTEYKGVDLATGEILFYEDIGNQTINIGEFLALCDAVRYIIENNYQPKRIFSDSMVAISWFKSKRTASGKRNPKLMKNEIYLRTMAHWIDKIEVIQWDNKLWGEIPADFNRKK